MSTSFLEQRPWQQRPRLGSIFAVLSLATTVFFLWNLPELFSFFAFGFRDNGSNLMLVKLIEAGQRPTIDFGYAYGLLSLLFSQVWLSAFGATPVAFVSSVYVLTLFFGYWFSRFLTAVDATWAHLALVVILWPFAIPPDISHSQAIEPILLLAALVLYLEEKPQWALAACTICLFVKPSMAYFLGLILVIILMVRSRPLETGGGKRLVRALLPAAVTGLILGACLAGYYGWAPLVTTLTAKTGQRIYRTDHFGVFGYGRSFFVNPSWKYYVGQPAGFWIFSMVVLVGVAAVIAAKHLRTRSPLGKRDILICWIAILMVAFHVFFYGPPESWIYYVFLLVIFWVLAMDRRELRWLVAAGLLLFLMTSFVAQRARLHYWHMVVRSPLTRGLATDPATLSQWSALYSLSQRSHVVVLSYGGGSAILFPEMETAPRLFLDPGLSEPGEVNATVAALKRADYIVLPSGMPYLNYWNWPAFGDVLRTFQTVDKNDHFTLLARPALRSSIVR